MESTVDGRNRKRETRGTVLKCPINIKKNIEFCWFDKMTNFDKKLGHLSTVPLVSKGEINARYKSDL